MSVGRSAPGQRSRPVRCRVTFVPELQYQAEEVEADAVRSEPGSGHVVLVRTQLVIGTPREVVVLRLRAEELASLEPC